MKATFIAAILSIPALIFSVQAMVPAAASAAVLSERIPEERVLLVAQDYKSYPIAMKCPRDNDGTFEIIFKGADGSTQRYRVELDENIVTTILIENAEKGEPLKVDFSVDLRNDTDPETLSVANRVLKMFEPVLNKVCDGNHSEKDRFKKFLSENRKEVGG